MFAGASGERYYNTLVAWHNNRRKIRIVLVLPQHSFTDEGVSRNQFTAKCNVK